MLTERDLHFLKVKCGRDVYSIRLWSGEQHGKEVRYYINLVDIHCLFTDQDKAARIWFTENNPALQVGLRGKPSRHWFTTVARM